MISVLMGAFILSKKEIKKCITLRKLKTNGEKSIKKSNHLNVMFMIFQNLAIASVKPSMPMIGIAYSDANGLYIYTTKSSLNNKNILYRCLFDVFIIKNNLSVK